jgi:Sulfotransferase family
VASGRGPSSSVSAASETSPGPVFIGGFARSGTHAAGPLVGAHPRYHLIRTEARFHAVPGGLADLLEGRTGIDRFLKRCRDLWWKRGFMRPQGLHLLVEREELEAALEEFQAGFERDRWAAGRRLVDELIGAAARREGAPSWVELTGRSVLYAPTLLQMFPSARFINMVRDGRAVAAGHLNKIDMTDDPFEALSNWERSIRDTEEAIRKVPQEFVLIVHLDDLVALDREGTYRRLVEFLEIDDDEPMRRWFDSKVTARRAHAGQWRERMSPPEARRVDRRYRRMLRDFRRDGIDWVPEPEDAGVWVGPVRIPTPSRSQAGLK